MTVIPLPKETYTDFELHYAFTTGAHYVPLVTDTPERMAYTLSREDYPTPRSITNTDILYEDTFPNAEAFAAVDDAGEPLGYLELAFEEWNNRERVTQLLVNENARRQGVGKALIDFAKSVARERDYRVIVLETQNYNTPAIDFYRSQGFRFCGGNVFFYSNIDVEDDEVMLEMAYLVE